MEAGTGRNWRTGITTNELLNAWREATRAAELAERLARIALEAADHADRHAVASEDIAALAESAAAAADKAAETARVAATRARSFATESHEGRLADADDAVVQARQVEAEARDRYHLAERRAQRRHQDGVTSS